VIEIRRAEPGDEVALCTIRRSAILELTAETMSPSQALLWANGAAPDRVAQAIARHAVWVAIETVQVGWVEVDEDRVAGLYVAPHSAGRGIGLLLLRHAEAAILDGGYTAAWLETSPNALNFYLRSGYGLRATNGDSGAPLLCKRFSEPNSNCAPHGATPRLPPRPDSR